MLTFTSTEKAAIVNALKSAAAAAVAKYPQYNGHFDNYILVRVSKRIKTKFGIAFEPEEYAIARPDVRRPEFGSRTSYDVRTVWSVRNSIDTSVLERDLTVVA